MQSDNYESGDIDPCVVNACSYYQNHAFANFLINLTANFAYFSSFLGDGMYSAP